MPATVPASSTLCRPPALTAEPLVKPCAIITGGEKAVTQCVVVVQKDWIRVVGQFKACCLGSGISKAECQIAD